MIKFFKKITIMLLLLITLTGCKNERKELAMVENENKILEDIKDEFKKLTLIPRPSHHEKEVSDYLVKRFNELGYEVYQDEALNVIAEKKVNDEDDFIILQGHMDMVACYEEGINFDPLKNHVEYIEEENIIHANKTTLGADDGIGLAMAIVLSQNVNKNIRIICTVDEEDGMTGAIALDPKYLQGKYLINIDNEMYNELCNSSAGGRKVECKKECMMEDTNDNDNSYMIKIEGLEGGHSGDDINKDRTNGIIEVFKLLNNEAIYNEGKIQKVDGGFAANAIPIKCEVTFTSVLNEEEIRDIFNKTYENSKDKDKITLVKLDEKINKTFTNKDSKEIINFVMNVINGVYTFSEKYKIVESSSNIGVISTEDNIVCTNSLLRSCEPDKMEEIYDNYVKTCEDNGFTYQIVSDNPAWPIKEGKLAPLCKECFERVNNEDYKIVQIHAALECSYFCVKNPDLEIVSVGPTVLNPHTPSEVVYVNSIMPLYKMIYAVMNSDF